MPTLTRNGQTLPALYVGKDSDGHPCYQLITGWQFNAEAPYWVDPDGVAHVECFDAPDTQPLLCA